MSIQSIRDEIKQIEIDLHNKKVELTRVESRCRHIWNVEYDPIHRKAEIISYSGSVGGYTPYDTVGFRCTSPAETLDRWKRTCTICGKVEYTNKFTEKVNKQPTF